MSTAPAQRTGPGPVTHREIWRLALPATLGALLDQAFRPLDQFFVQGLGGAAQGALGATTFVLILCYGGFLLVSAGVGPLAARANGAGSREREREVVGTGLVLAAILGLMMVVLGAFAVPTIVSLLGLHGEIALHAEGYLRAIFLTGLFMAMGPTVDAAFYARGNTQFPLLMQVLALGLNAVLNPLLITTAGLGTVGAGLASTLSRSTVVLVGLFVLMRHVGLRPRSLGITPVWRAIMRVGSPVALSTSAYAGVYWGLLYTTISPLGPAVNAALGIGFSALEAVTWPVFWGMSTAVSSIVGRRLGAGQPEEAWRALRYILGPVLCAGVLALLGFRFLGDPVIGWFTEDPEVHAQALVYAMALAWSQPFVAIEALTEGVLGGSGDTRKLFYINVPINLVRIPLGYGLAFGLGLGAWGVWWAINVTSVVKSLTKAFWVWRGDWSRLELGD